MSKALIPLAAEPLTAVGEPFLTRLFRSPLVRSSIVYTASTGLNAAIPLLIMPVLTRYLTPVDYGIVSMMGALVGIFGPFIGLSIHGAISVRYFDGGRRDIGRYVGNCFFLLCASTAAVSAVLWLFGRSISELAEFPYAWLPAIVLICVSQFIALVLLTLWQVQDRALAYGMFQIGQSILNVAITLALVVGMRMEWQGRVLGQTFAVSTCALFAVVLLRRQDWLRLAYDRADLVHALKFGVPLIPHALGAMLIAQTGRLFITNMVSVADTGVYMVGLQLATVVELFAASFNKAYVPWLYQRLAAGDTAVKRRIVKLTYLYFVGILAAAIAVSAGTSWVLPSLVGRDFAGAGRYTTWIAVGFAFSGMYYMVANYIFYAGATHLLAWITFATAVANVGLNYILIRMNGALGAAQASALALLMSFVLTWVLSARVYPMPWTLARRTES